MSEDNVYSVHCPYCGAPEESFCENQRKVGEHCKTHPERIKEFRRQEENRKRQDGATR